MPTEVQREDVQRMLMEGAQVVEVLGSKQYQKAHIADAINIPLGTLDRQSTRQLRHDQPVITYCADFQ